MFLTVVIEEIMFKIYIKNNEQLRDWTKTSERSARKS